MKRRTALFAALFLDLPFLVDSFWRKFEYEANRNHIYRLEPANQPIAPRPLQHTAQFVWLLLLLVFVTFGPTHAPLCGVLGSALPRMMYGALAVLAFACGAWFVLAFGKALLSRARERLDSCEATSFRRRTLWAALGAFLAAGTLGFAWLTVHLASITWQDALCTGNERSWQSVALLIVVPAAIACAWWLARRARGVAFWVRPQSALVLLLIAAQWWLLADGSAREADERPYRHAYAVLAAALFLIVLLAPWLAHHLFKEPAARVKPLFMSALRHTELFVQRADPDLAVQRIWHAIVNGIVHRPLLWFLLPSLIVIVVPDSYLYGSFGVAFVASTLLLAWGSISLRWQQMVSFVHRWFFTGTPFVVSVGVIALAAARLAGNHYVATVLTAAPFGALFMWVVMIYGLLWVFEHSMNQAVGAKLLALLTDADTSEGYSHYAIAAEETEKVAAEGRYLALHSAGRFAVVGRHTKPRGDVAVFHTYGYLELFSALASNATHIEDQVGEAGFASRLNDAVAAIERRGRLYFNLMNVAVAAVVLALLAYAQYHDKHYSTEPVVVADSIVRTSSLSTPAGGPRNFDLRAALLGRGATGQPAVIIAASGGGTRAALYTASTLDGLAQLGVLEHVVLASGVSGGGVALADFAAHREQLRHGATYDAHAWDAFKHRAAEPFIQDVIEGALEWRLVGAVPLSALLVESFDRRVFASGLQRLGDIGAFGLVLNTSITGHPAFDSTLVANSMQPHSGEFGEAACIPYSYLSGARLVFTNLAHADSFPLPGTGRLTDVSFPFVVVNDPHIRLSGAAALNANFPPVFPNARVNLRDTRMQQCGGVRSYYVTDGGATENLGLISALYALQAALADWPSGAPLPPLHIVAIEASAVALDYGQDRGISTATGGAKERLAGGLTDLLLRDVEQRVSALSEAGETAATLRMHYLSLPLALRSRGGVGTHWMLAKDILVTNPHRARPLGYLARSLALGSEARDRVRIQREELFELLRALHSKDASLCDPVTEHTLDVQVVVDWICGKDGVAGADFHVAQWRELVGTFGPQRH